MFLSSVGVDIIIFGFLIIVVLVAVGHAWITHNYLLKKGKTNRFAFLVTALTL